MDLAGVHGGYNAVLVEASSAEDLMFYGKGADEPLFVLRKMNRFAIYFRR